MPDPHELIGAALTPGEQPPPVGIAAAMVREARDEKVQSHLRGLLKLRDEEIRSAHFNLDLFEIRRYERTDFPLPLGRRIHLLGEHRNRLTRRCRAAGLPTD